MSTKNGQEPDNSGTGGRNQAEQATGKAGIRSADVWTWDGRELRPKNSHRSADAWAWDGRELKPKVYSPSARVYVADGEIPVPILALFAMGVLS